MGSVFVEFAAQGQCFIKVAWAASILLPCALLDPGWLTLVALAAPGPSDWLDLAGLVAPGHPGWLNLVTLPAPGRPGRLHLVALVAPGRPGWLDLAALVAPGRPGWLSKAKKRLAFRLSASMLPASSALERFVMPQI